MHGRSRRASGLPLLRRATKTDEAKTVERVNLAGALRAQAPRPPREGAGVRTEGYVIRNGRRIAVVTDDFDVKPKRKKRDFVMVTRAQFERLCTTRHPGITLKVFLHLQFLIFRSHQKSVRLGNITLGKRGVSRKQKRAALIELETVGLIRVTRYRHHSPEIVILDLP